MNIQEKTAELISKITEALKDRGDYSSDLTEAISLCATNGALFYALSDEMSTLEHYVTQIVTTSGSVKYEAHPLVGMVTNASALYRQQLSELGLTPKAVSSQKKAAVSKTLKNAKLAEGQKAEVEDPLMTLIRNCQ